MSVDKKILEEITRFNSINRYINEQELPPPPAEDPLADPLAAGAPPVDPLAGAPPADPASAGAPPAGATPPAPPAGEVPQPVDIATDPEVEKVEDEGKDEKTKEVEVTELVKSQKNVEEKQEEYFQQLFSHLENLESKLGEMDNIVNQLNSLEAKVEKYREKSPEEKLELRTLDSGPFNQKLSQYFEDKEEDFEKLGRDEYILTKDDVTDFSPKEMQKTFREYPGRDEEVFKVKY
jgi:hypothetical protein